MENDINKIEIRDSLLSINQNYGNIDRYSAPKNLDCPVSSAIEYPSRAQVNENNRKNCQHLNLHLNLGVSESTLQYTVDPSILTGNLSWRDHWLYNYNFNKEFIKRRMHSINDFRAEVSFGKKFPQIYEISCKDCREIIKRGNKFPTSHRKRVFIIFVVILMIFIGLTLFFIFGFERNF